MRRSRTTRVRKRPVFIAADGFYLLATDEKQQAAYVGIRTMFYRIANIFGQGLIVMLAGEVATRTGDVHHAWAVAMAVLAALFLVFGLWHAWILPRPASDRSGDVRRAPDFVREFVAAFGSFFRKPGAGTMVAYCCSTGSVRRSWSSSSRRSCWTRATTAGWP